MTSFHSWDDVKREVFDAEDLDEIAAGARRMISEARAHRLAEMHKELGLTQSEVAARLHVRQERVSAIERGNANATGRNHRRLHRGAGRQLGDRGELQRNPGGRRVEAGGPAY